ncbi:MAG TPA: globin domain-containing protein [Thermohalobaculum sp.]|nr:globin domain-containing protein [Thermohalobaculum sp.]
MNLTTAQIEMIRDSFHCLEPDAEVAEMFYDRLFDIAPELRAMFRGDMTGQGMRFMRTLRVIVQYLDEPEALRPHLEKLARGHLAYGVRPEHFHPMGQALIWTMQESMGEAFPEGAALAWEAAYDRLADEMIALAG